MYVWELAGTQKSHLRRQPLNFLSDISTKRLSINENNTQNAEQNEKDRNET